MSEYCAISTRNFSRKEVDEFGKVTILRKDITRSDFVYDYVCAMQDNYGMDVN